MKKRRKIFQRAAALLCCILVLSVYFVLPASADSSDDGFFDVLQFGTANGSGTQVVTGAVPFDVVYQTTSEPFFYIDCVIVSPQLVYLEYNGQLLERLLINNVDGAYRWRMYGPLVGDPSGYLNLKVVMPGNEGANASVIFEQLRVASMSYSQTFTPTVGTVLASPYEWVPSETMPDASTAASITFESNNVSFAYDYFAKLSFSTWKRYDYLDVYFTVRAASINSISVQLGDVFVPYELTYLDSGLVPDSSWGSDGAAPADNVYDCTMRIDLTGLYRNVGSDVPTILINGSYMPYMAAQGVTLTSVTGVVIGSVPSETATFWQRLQGFWVGIHADLKSFFQGLISGSNEFQEEVDQSITEFEEAESDMDEDIDNLDTPDVNDVDIVSKIEESGANTATLSDFFEVAFDNVVVNWLMILSFSFMLISFLLYGSFR